MDDQNQAVKQLLEAEEAKRKEQEAWLKEQLSNRLQDGRVAAIDWSPLAAQLDAMAGGPKVAQAAAGSAFNQALAEEKKDQDLLDLLNQMQNPRSQSAVGQALKEAGKQESIQGRFDDSQVKAAFKDVNEKLMKKSTALSDINSALNQVDAALSQGDRDGIMAKLSMVAKSINKESGALSDSDVSRQVMTSLLSDVDQMIYRITGEPAKLNEAAIKNLLRSVTNARGEIANAGKADTDAFVSAMSGNPTYRAALEQARAKGGYVDRLYNLSSEVGRSRFQMKKEQESKPAEAKPAAPKKATAADILSMLQSAPNK
jgi:hypothetical protein